MCVKHVCCGGGGSGVDMKESQVSSPDPKKLCWRSEPLVAVVVSTIPKTKSQNSNPGSLWFAKAPAS